MGQKDEVETTAARLRKTVVDLAEGIGPRAPGSAAEKRAAEYLLSQFIALDIDTQIVEFSSPSHCAEGARLALVENSTAFDCLPAQFSRLGLAEGKLFFAGDSDGASNLSADCAGKIGLFVPNGDHEKRLGALQALERAGLAGAIVVSPSLSTVGTKLCRYPELEIPVVSVSFETGAALKRYEGETVTLDVHGTGIATQVSRNIVASLAGDSDDWLVVDAHYDSAPFCPGAGDNASGVAVVLELARRLRGSRPAATVVFLLTGSEEYGGRNGFGRGAVAFYEDPDRDLAGCIGHIDVDSVGTSLGCPVLYLSGPGSFRDALLSESIVAKYRILGRSGQGCDHGAAEANGIPCAWFTDVVQGNFPQLHTPEDRVEHLDFEAMAGVVDDLQDAVNGLGRTKPAFDFVDHGDLQIRPARYRDIARILDITRSAFGEMSQAFLQQQYFGEKVGGKDWWEYKLRDIEEYCRANMLSTIVAESGGAVVGYATYTVDTERGVGAIGNNAVDPAYQRRGIGTRLQAEVDGRMKREGLAKFQVSTLGHDVPAQRVYENLGYARLTETYHYVRRG